MLAKKTTNYTESNRSMNKRTLNKKKEKFRYLNKDKTRVFSVAMTSWTN